MILTINRPVGRKETIFMENTPLPETDEQAVETTEGAPSPSAILRRFCEVYGTEEGMKRFQAGEEPP